MTPLYFDDLSYEEEVWLDQVHEEYFLYLESLTEDECPMDLDAFQWLKIREVELERAETELQFSQNF